MKSLNNFNVRYKCLRNRSNLSFLAVLILFFTSCTSKPEPYSILEFTGIDAINNFSKSYMLILSESDSLNPAVIMGSNGDLFWCDEYLFQYNDPSSQNRFSFKYTDSVLYINNKIHSIIIPDKNDTIPWFKNVTENDLSALQFINVSSELPESYFPYLAGLANIKSDAGIYHTGNFRDMAGLLEIFNPRIIAGPSLVRSDFEQLSKLTNLEILMTSLTDSVITDPLPSMPELKQLFLTDLDDNVALTNNFLVNNRQIERLIIQKSGDLDFSILDPLDNLKELVVNVSGAILNLTLVNDHTRLEVLSVAGDDLIYDPDLIKLPLLRWMTFSSGVTQKQFDSFIDKHGDLEVIELIKNDTISSLQALSKLPGLYGLTINDTITDVATVKTLNNLKYLSLPGDFLDDPLNKSEMQKSLPGTRITANEGFCLGSGWLLLLIPLVLILRFFGRRFQNGTMS